MHLIPFLCAALLATVFAWAAASKLAQHSRWTQALATYRLGSWARSVAIATPVLEALVAGLLLFGATRVGAALSLALIAVFCLALLRARDAAGDRLPCACFGGRRDSDYRLLLARNALLASFAAVVLIGGRDVRVGDLVASGDVVPVLLTAAAVGLAGWAASNTAAALRRHGR